jgi:hypothetical protein
MAFFTKSEGTDAIALLKQDHRMVEGLFREFERSGPAEQDALARRVCNELVVHAQLEEKIFYPAVREAVPDQSDLLDEAEVEHDSIRHLIEKLSGAKKGDPMLMAHMNVLKEYVKHHVREEEHRVMLKLRRSELDLHLLGQKLMDEKERLTSRQTKSEPRPKDKVRQPRPKAAAARGKPLKKRSSKKANRVSR